MRVRYSNAFIVAGAMVGSGCYSGIEGHRGADQDAADTSGDGADGGADDGADDGDTPSLDVEPAPPTLHRLTQAQLHNTYLAVLGSPLQLPTELPPDDLLYGFSSIAAAAATISPLAAEQYENATYAVLDQVWGDPLRRTVLVGCDPETATDPCVAEFFARFAKAAWRRPVTSDEVDRLVALSDLIADELDDVDAGIEHGAAAVLQSPNFLFRIEMGVPVADAPGVLRYTSWEMASRLSYLIVAGPPDEELVALAEADALDSVDVIEAQALRLLDDPRARPALVGFFRDFMNIAKLDQLDKNPEAFPQMSATLGPAMREELERMFEATVFDGSGSFRDLFTTKTTAINEELAGIYGVPGIVGAALQPYTFPPDSPRAGILTSAGFLAVNAHQTQTSPTHRGRFVRIQMLCQDIPPPPAGIDTSLPAPDPSAPPQTLRERLDIHRESPACLGCHELMDPIGFAFENYDAIGAYREVDEQGLTLDPVTEINGTTVASGVEVGELIAELPEASACIARRFYEHAGGHVAEDGEDEAIDALVDAFVADDYDFRSLVVALVVNDGFRFAGSEVAQ